MSLILKGIDMPKEKDEALLLLILGDGTVAEKIGSDRYEEMANTKAIQIPTPHGRLIDASELIKSYMKGTKTDIDDFYDTIDIIDNAPTILEEEK